MSRPEATGDYRVFGEQALLDGVDLDLDAAPVETAGAAHTPRPRPRVRDAGRHRLVRLALAVAAGAVVGLVVVTGIRVLAHVASRLGASPSAVAGAQRLTGTSRPRGPDARRAGGTGIARRSRHRRGMVRGPTPAPAPAQPAPRGERVATARAGRVTTELGAAGRAGPAASGQDAAGEFGFEQ